jgi:hypothetical protein
MPSSTEEPTDVPNQQPRVTAFGAGHIDLKTAIPPRVASPRRPTQRRRNIGNPAHRAAAMTGFSMVEDVGDSSLYPAGRRAHGAYGAAANELSAAVLAMQNAYTDAASVRQRG